MENELICSKCGSSLNENDVFCNSCGFPERGTLEDKKKYNFSIHLKKNVIEDANKKLNNVKILLYVITGLNVIIGLINLSNDYSYAQGIGNLIAAALFLGCALWVNNQPLVGVLAAFILWILLQLSVVLINPALLFSGIILKVIFIGIFVKGIASAKDYLKFSEQLKEMKEM